MMRAEQRGYSRARYDHVWLSAIVRKFSQPRCAPALDFILWKRGVENDVGNKIERAREILGERTRSDARSIHAGTGGESRSQQRRFIGNLRRVARRRALLQHVRGETCKSGLIDGICAAPGVENEIRGHHR